MNDFSIEFLSTVYIAEQRLKMQSEECKDCWCFSCANQEKYEKCKEKCFKRCKTKKYIWTKCGHYQEI